MMQITRQQRRALQRLADAVSTVTDSDRRYFERFPERQHRIRRMAAAEMESAAVTHDLTPMGPGSANFTLVKNIAPGCRLRFFITGPADRSGDETLEATAAALWDHYADRNPWLREREQAFTAAARQPGGPLHDGGMQ